MKIEIEMDDDAPFNTCIQFSMIGADTERFAITSGAFILAKGTHVYVDHTGKMKQSKKGRKQK